jgi:hypothetical protein
VSDQFLKLAVRVVYFVAAGILLLLALTLLGFSVWELVDAILTGHDIVRAALRDIGLLIIAIAVFDVAKFLIEEEVIHDRELRSATEARRSLTKFMTIIIVAVNLEVLVLIFETGHSNVRDLIYPASLFLVAVLALVGLALFQRFSTESQAIKPDDHELPSDPAPVPSDKKRRAR